MRRTFWLALAATLFSCLAVLPADDMLKSGPQVGEKLPGSFHPLNVNGSHANHEHCLVCDYGLDPVVLIFAREVPTAGASLALLQKVDKALEDHQAASLKAFVVFLSPNFAKEEDRKDLVQKIESLTKLPDQPVKQLALSADSASELEQLYKLDKGAELTVLLYKELKVVNNFAYAKDKLTDKDVDAVLTAVDKMLPAKKKKK
jgi:hypothetical protein